MSIGAPVQYQNVEQSSEATKIVSLLRSYWTQSNTAKKDTDRVHARVIQSYNCELPEKVLNSKAIQTKAHLGWTAKAVDAFTSRLAPLLIPSAKDFFSLYDTSQKYALSCSLMTNYMTYFFENAKVEELATRMIDTMALEGAIGLQPRWDYCKGLNELPDLDIFLINPQDIGVYPITEPIKRAVMMIRTYLTKQELLNMAQADTTQSFSLPVIQQLKQSTAYTRPVPTNSTNRTNTYNQRLGLEVVDYYAPALEIEEQMLYNVRATIVSGTTLIRFTSSATQQSQHSGAIFACLNELYIRNVGPVRVGVGLCNKAIDLEMAAITINNLSIDNVKDIVKPPRTYDPLDKYWNRDRSSFAPGEFIAITSTNPRHLMPVDQSVRTLPQAQEAISQLMYQFEGSVGMPNFLSGTSDTDDRRVSATAKRLEANGADTNLRQHGKNINSRAIKPLSFQVYEMIRAKVTQEMQSLGQAVGHFQKAGYPINQQLVMQVMQQFPFLKLGSEICTDFADWFQAAQPIPAIEAISLDLSTFEDAIQKVDQVNNAERILGTLMPLGASDPQLAAQLMAEIDLSTFIRVYVNSLDMGSILKPLSQVSQAMEQNQQEQQVQKQKSDAIQAAQLELEGNKLAAETAKLQAETEKSKAEVQKYQAETLQTLQETNNPPKEKTSGKST